MAWEEQEVNHGGVWDDLDYATQYLDADEMNLAHEYYEIGFMHTAEEYDALGIDPETVSNYREEFFDLLGLEYEDFPWDEWREAMGYGND